MSAAKVKEAWNRIERWCRENHPGLLEVLNAGASKERVAALEDEIQHSLPADMIESLLIHDGQPDRIRPQFLFGQLTLASCDRIAREYKRWKGSDPGDPPTTYGFFPEGAISYRQHDDGWIPIAYEDGCGNCLAIDLAPGPKGIRGQVIDFGADIHDLGVMAPSWGDFLLSYAKLLESGTLGTIDPEPDWWDTPFHSLFQRAAIDALVLWTMDGRWPLIDSEESWRTSTVLGVACQVDDTRDFSTMPVLADALEEAGCENVATLGHCRDPECKHAKGCWLIDMIVRGRVEHDRYCHSFPGERQD